MLAEVTGVNESDGKSDSWLPSPEAGLRRRSLPIRDPIYTDTEICP
jgi:hypothetical protein